MKLPKDVYDIWDRLKNEAEGCDWYKSWKPSATAGLINCARAYKLISKEEHKLLMLYKDYLK